MLWNLPSEKVGPLWHSLHAALPMKRAAPRIAAGVIAEASPASIRSNAEGSKAGVTRRRWYASSDLPRFA
jgi:hypothetical protein